MSALPPIVVRQPQPFDLVDDPVEVCGIGTGFEATFAARVRDGGGAQLSFVTITAGGTGIWGNFHATLPLNGVPTTPHGQLEVFEVSAKDGRELHKIVVWVTFGTALLQPYHGFAQYTVVPGDTLSAIAQQWYGDASQRPRVCEATRNQLIDPDIILPGKVLPLPQ